jgi:hypothetical protein
MKILGKNLIALLGNYALRRKIIVYVKNKGSNLNTMTITLKSIVSCDVIGLEENFKTFVLVMHFLKLINMLRQRKKIAKTYDMCQSKLPKEI